MTERGWKLIFRFLPYLFFTSDERLGVMASRVDGNFLACLPWRPIEVQCILYIILPTPSSRRGVATDRIDPLRLAFFSNHRCLSTTDDSFFFSFPIVYQIMLFIWLTAHLGFLLVGALSHNFASRIHQATPCCSEITLHRIQTKLGRTGLTRAFSKTIDNKQNPNSKEAHHSKIPPTPSRRCPRNPVLARC